MWPEELAAAQEKDKEKTVGEKGQGTKKYSGTGWIFHMNRTGDEKKNVS